LDAVIAQTSTHGIDLKLCLDLHGEMIHPTRCRRIRHTAAVVAQVEKSDVRMVGELEEQVYKRAKLAGRGHVLFLDHVHQGQTQDVFVKMARFFRVSAAPSEMMQALDRRAWCGRWLGRGVDLSHVAVSRDQGIVRLDGLAWAAIIS